MVTRFVVNYYILPIDANASARQNVVITTFCNVTTFWVATRLSCLTVSFPLRCSSLYYLWIQYKNVDWLDMHSTLYTHTAQKGHKKKSMTNCESWWLQIQQLIMIWQYILTRHCKDFTRHCKDLALCILCTCCIINQFRKYYFLVPLNDQWQNYFHFASVCMIFVNLTLTINFEPWVKDTSFECTSIDYKVNDPATLMLIISFFTWLLVGGSNLNCFPVLKLV